jgi:hypothetical protein
MDNTNGGGIVTNNRSSGLGVAELVEDMAQPRGVLPVHEQGSIFRFSGRCCDDRYLHAVGVNGAVDVHWVIMIAEKVEAASRDGGAVGAREVRAVRVRVQYHITRGEDQGRITVR